MRLSSVGSDFLAARPGVGAFVQTTRSGCTVFTSGQIAVDGSAGLLATGRVGADVDAETALLCARQCALNILAQLEEAYGLDNVIQVLKLTVFVASDPAFTGQHLVANGASAVLAEVLGEAGEHTRSAIGVAALPLGSPVEVEAIIELHS
ncbi:MAG: RidA family protein [Streptosporangiaceae bacterium]